MSPCETYLRYCVIIPTYNNSGTVADVVERALKVCPDVIVVNDGSTDNTSAVLCGLDVVTLSHEHNMGKGEALKTGLYYAGDNGFTHAITIDSDGQHFPEDIPDMIKASKEHPDRLIVGCRNLTSENMPRKSTFANRFSNFWFRLQTAQKLSDTQSGFRIYPLESLHGMRLITSKYEAELELLVFAAWNGVTVQGVPVRVWYAPDGERVSHVRPFHDFFRITLLNTFLCFGALLYAVPAALVRWIKGKRHG